MPSPMMPMPMNPVAMVALPGGCCSLMDYEPYCLAALQVRGPLVLVKRWCTRAMPNALLRRRLHGTDAIDAADLDRVLQPSEAAKRPNLHSTCVKDLLQTANGIKS